MEDDEHPGHSCISKNVENVENIGKINRNDWRLSIRMIAKINIDKRMVQQMLHNNLSMKKVCAKIIPKNLSQDQEDNRNNIFSDNLQTMNEQPNLLKNVITCDETCIFQYYPEIKRQSMRWKTSHQESRKLDWASPNWKSC